MVPVDPEEATRASSGSLVTRRDRRALLGLGSHLPQQMTGTASVVCKTGAGRHRVEMRPRRAGRKIYAADGRSWGAEMGTMHARYLPMNMPSPWQHRDDRRGRRRQAHPPPPVPASRSNRRVPASSTIGCAWASAIWAGAAAIALARASPGLAPLLQCKSIQVLASLSTTRHDTADSTWCDGPRAGVRTHGCWLPAARLKQSDVVLRQPPRARRHPRSLSINSACCMHDARVSQTRACASPSAAPCDWWSEGNCHVANHSLPRFWPLAARRFATPDCPLSATGAGPVTL